MIDITAVPTRMKFKGGTPLRERPITFSTPMVRAILAGAKTQTRRIVRMHADGSSYDRCRYGVPGDRLWVKETWGRRETLVGSAPHRVYYAADWADPRPFKSLSPRFMPRWASRLLLQVTGVRVERLQDITEQDAHAEGVDLLGGPRLGRDWASSKRDAFSTLWDAINGKRLPWSANPWVFVVAFRRLP